MPEYIEKSAVINALIDVENRYNRNRDHENVSAEALYKDLCNAEGKIGKTPAAEVAPVVHGRCEFCRDGKTFIGAIAVGGNDGRFHKINYCPNCGAKMDLEGPQP